MDPPPNPSGNKHYLLIKILHSKSAMQSYIKVPFNGSVQDIGSTEPTNGVIVPAVTSATTNTTSLLTNESTSSTASNAPEVKRVLLRQEDLLRAKNARAAAAAPTAAKDLASARPASDSELVLVNVSAADLPALNQYFQTNNRVPTSLLVPTSSLFPTNNPVPAGNMIPGGSIALANNDATANDPVEANTARAPVPLRAYASIEYANKIIYFNNKLAKRLARKPKLEYILAETSIQNGIKFDRFEIKLTILPIGQKKPPTELFDVPDLEESDATEQLQQLATKSFSVFYDNAKSIYGLRVQYKRGLLVSVREDQVTSIPAVQAAVPGPSQISQNGASPCVIQSVTKRPAEMPNIAGPSKQSKVSSVLSLSDQAAVPQASGTGVQLSVANKGPTPDLAGTSKSTLPSPPNLAINSSAPNAPTPNANAPGPSKQANVPSISTNWDQIVAQTAPSNQTVPVNPPKDTSILGSASSQVAGTSPITTSQPMHAPTTTLPQAFASLANFPSLNTPSVEVANQTAQIGPPMPSKQPAPPQAVIQGKGPKSSESVNILPGQPKQPINTTASLASTTPIVNDSQKSKAIENVAVPTASAFSAVEKAQRGLSGTNKQTVATQTSAAKRSAEIKLPQAQHSKQAKVLASVPTPSVREEIVQPLKQAKVLASVPTPPVREEIAQPSKQAKVLASVSTPSVREEIARTLKQAMVLASVSTSPVREQTTRPSRSASSKSRKDKPVIKKSKTSKKLARSSQKQPKGAVSTVTTDLVPSTARTRGQSKRLKKAKLTTTIAISSDQEETQMSESSDSSPSIESPTVKQPESDGFDWDRRYPKREVKSVAPFVPNLEPSFVRKSKSLIAKNETSMKPETEVTPRVVQQRPSGAAAVKDSTKDKFCWKCHLPGDLHHCSRCSLGWHKSRSCSDAIFQSKLKSMTMILDKSSNKATRELYAKKQAWVAKLETVLDPSVCIECARKEAGRKFNKDDGFLSGIKTLSDKRRSAALYEYAVKSLIMRRKPEEKRSSFRSLARIDYGEYDVKNKIDLNWILKKTAHVTAYLCTEEFMFDIKMLCHSYMILTQKKGVEVGSLEYKLAQSLCTDLIESARSEMDSVDRCDSCYRNLYEVDTDRVESDMLMPCEHSHSVVWLQHRNLWWPGKVYEHRENTFYFRSEKNVYVVPFGDEEAGKFSQVKLLYRYSQHEPITDENEQMQAAFNGHSSRTCRKNREAREKGIEDAKQYMVKYWNRYFLEKYPLARHARPFTVNNFYQPNGGLKKKTLDENFKLGSACKSKVPLENEQVSTERESSSRSTSRLKSSSPSALAIRASIAPEEAAAASKPPAVAGPAKRKRGNPGKNRNPKDIRFQVVQIACPEKGCLFMAPTLQLVHHHQKHYHKVAQIHCFAAGCKRRFSYSLGLARHIEEDHPSTVQFRCDICARVYPGQRHAYQHWYKQHMIGIYRCVADSENCKFECNNRWGIYNHYTKNHE